MTDKANKMWKWFWNIIESNKPLLTNLEMTLEQSDQETVENYFALYTTASQEIVDYWDAPFSEDSTEDICDWIVSQGKVFWEIVVNNEIDLLQAHQLMVEIDIVKSESEPKPTPKPTKYANMVCHWNNEVKNEKYQGYQSPKALAIGVYYEKFDRNIYDFEETIFERLEDDLFGME